MPEPLKDINREHTCHYSQAPNRPELRSPVLEDAVYAWPEDKEDEEHEQENR